MLRPATPLTVIFLVAFALLLLSTISTPIIKGIPLGSYGGYNFGVFGYCKGSSDCSAIGIGYSTGIKIQNSGDSSVNMLMMCRRLVLQRRLLTPFLDPTFALFNSHRSPDRRISDTSMSLPRCCSALPRPFLFTSIPPGAVHPHDTDAAHHSLGIPG